MNANYAAEQMRQTGRRILGGVSVLYLVCIGVAGWLVVTEPVSKSGTAGGLGLKEYGAMDFAAGASVQKIVDRMVKAALVYQQTRDGRINKETAMEQHHKLVAEAGSPLGIRVADRNGAVVWGQEASSNIGTQAYFTGLRDTPQRRLWISRAVHQQGGKPEWVVLVAARLADSSGVFSGIVYTAVPVNQLLGPVAATAGTKITALELREEAGKLVARWPDPAETFAKFDVPPRSESIAQLLAQTTVAQSRVGETLVHAQHLKTWPYVLVAELAGTESVSGELRQSTVVAGLLVVMLLITLVGWMLFYRRWRSAASDMMLFKTIFEEAPVGMELISTEGEVLVGNRALCDMVGHEPMTMLKSGWNCTTVAEDAGKDSKIVQTVLGKPREIVRTEKRYLHRDGHTVWAQRTLGTLCNEDGTVRYLVAHCEDITQRKEHQNHMKDMAYIDTLTKLPNRRMLMEQLGLTINQTRWNMTSCALMFVDLDGFKGINDTLGHDYGDEILKEAAKRFKLCVRGEDMVARQGGDEFVIILKEIASSENAGLVAQKVVETMREPFVIGPHNLKVTSSIGITVMEPNDACSMDELMKRADSAMYWTKQAGRNGYTFFDATRAAAEAAH